MPTQTPPTRKKRVRRPATPEPILPRWLTKSGEYSYRTDVGYWPTWHPGTICPPCEADNINEFLCIQKSIFAGNTHWTSDGLTTYVVRQFVHEYEAKGVPDAAERSEWEGRVLKVLLKGKPYKEPDEVEKDWPHPGWRALLAWREATIAAAPAEPDAALMPQSVVKAKAEVQLEKEEWERGRPAREAKERAEQEAWDEERRFCVDALNAGSGLSPKIWSEITKADVRRWQERERFRGNPMSYDVRAMARQWKKENGIVEEVDAEKKSLVTAEMQQLLVPVTKSVLEERVRERVWKQSGILLQETGSRQREPADTGSDQHQQQPVHVPTTSRVEVQPGVTATAPATGEPPTNAVGNLQQSPARPTQPSTATLVNKQPTPQNERKKLWISAFMKGLQFLQKFIAEHPGSYHMTPVDIATIELVRRLRRDSGRALGGVDIETQIQHWRAVHKMLQQQCAAFKAAGVPDGGKKALQWVVNWRYYKDVEGLPEGHEMMRRFLEVRRLLLRPQVNREKAMPGPSDRVVDLTRDDEDGQTAGLPVALTAVGGSGSASSLSHPTPTVCHKRQRAEDNANDQEASQPRKRQATSSTSQPSPANNVSRMPQTPPAPVPRTPRQHSDPAAGQKRFRADSSVNDDGQASRPHKRQATMPTPQAQARSSAGSTPQRRANQSVATHARYPSNIYANNYYQIAGQGNSLVMGGQAVQQQLHQQQRQHGQFAPHPGQYPQPQQHMMQGPPHTPAMSRNTPMSVPAQLMGGHAAQQLQSQSVLQNGTHSPFQQPMQRTPQTPVTSRHMPAGMPGSPMVATPMRHSRAQTPAPRDPTHWNRQAHQSLGAMQGGRQQQQQQQQRQAFLQHQTAAQTGAALHPTQQSPNAMNGVPNTTSEHRLAPQTPGPMAGMPNAMAAHHPTPRAPRAASTHLRPQTPNVGFGATNMMHSYPPSPFTPGTMQAPPTPRPQQSPNVTMPQFLTGPFTPQTSPAIPGHHQNQSLDVSQAPPLPFSFGDPNDEAFWGLDIDTWQHPQ